MTCFKETGQPNLRMEARPVEESGLYRMKCDRGHETVTCLQQMKFEVLMDLAAYAITDGYYREAVSSFAAALERFQEFYIRVQCDRQKIAAAGVEAAWKHVSAQSERQLGAFAFAYLGANGTPPPMLSPNDVKFRNDAIHKGRIPSREEAIRFGERVLEIILPVLTPLRASAEEFVQRAVQSYVREVQTRARVQSPNVTGQSAATLICLARAQSERQPTLREWIEGLEAQRRTFSSVVAATA
jgi:hypothetical protein